MDRLNFNSYDESETESRDPEISLGAATILGIFLALTLVCALFFGLGYSMGRRSAQPAVATTSEPAPAETKAVVTTPITPATKPSSGNPASGDQFPYPAATPPPSTATVPLPPAPTAIPEKTTGKPAATPTIPTGNFIVQIAAVSHREDADSLINALEQRGYTVFIRNEPQDKLLHVQVGPFTTRKDADAMRQHLLYDGYNAIIK